MTLRPAAQVDKQDEGFALERAAVLGAAALQSASEEAEESAVIEQVTNAIYNLRILGNQLEALLSKYKADEKGACASSGR